MKLVTFRNDRAGPDRVGVLTPSGQDVVDLSAEAGSMLELIELGAAGLQLARRAMEAPDAPRQPLAQLRLQAPIPLPRQMRDAMTFETHLRQSIAGIAKLRAGRLGELAARLGLVRIPAVWYAQPTYYKCNRFSVIGPDADVVWPKGARLMDFELEIAAVIGKTGKDIARADALSHVFGYMIYNDMTARDLQVNEMRGHLGPAKGKDFDTGNVLGPWLVTADELDPYDLTMIARVNGEEWGRGHSGSMHHRWDAVIAHVSANETLHAGELIGSGTVGNGCGLEHGRFLQPNDVIELEISGLGTLRNKLVGS